MLYNLLVFPTYYTNIELHLEAAFPHIKLNINDLMEMQWGGSGQMFLPLASNVNILLIIRSTQRGSPKVRHTYTSADAR